MRSSALLCTLLLLSSLLLLQASAHGGIDDGDGEVDTPPRPDSNKGSSPSRYNSLVILFVFTFLGGVSPYFYHWSDAFLLLGTQFAAGVFLGTALMHFHADSVSTFHGLTKNPYPISYMLVCVGFLLTMLADCVIAGVTKRSRRVRERAVDEAEQQEDDNEDRHQHHGKDHQHLMLVRTSSLEDAIMLILALFFHSVFEGIAIGVSATKRDVWRNLWTIGQHKVFAAVAMGTALLRIILKRPLVTTVVYSVAFAVSSPVGVGIGIDAMAEGRAADWSYVIAMGFAMGVFVYEPVNHLIAKGYRPQEPTRADRPLLRFLAMLLSVAVMSVIMIWG